MKNVIKCWKDFFSYLITLETYRVCYTAYLFTYFPLFVSATGNELEMQGVEIHNDTLLLENGNPVEYNFQEPDYDDIDSDYVPGYRKCQAQCNGW